MSRVGKLPVAIPEGVKATYTDGVLSASGPKGELQLAISKSVLLTLEEGVITVRPANDDDPHARAMYGTVRSLCDNVIRGVHEGFQKTLVLSGTGYRVAAKKNTITLSLGYSHPVYYVVPENIQVSTEGQNTLIIQGADKQLVGKIAAEIRSLRKPDPYKNKGVAYKGERLVKKEGKKK